MPPSICSSAIELMPKLTPSVGSRSRFPCKPGRRVEHVVLLVEAAFDQHQSRADRFGIFGDERPLLGIRTRRRAAEQDARDRVLTCASVVFSSRSYLHAGNCALAARLSLQHQRHRT